ncbi:MAG: glycine zipper family protein [Rickettsiales bacterium]|jgi:hypothetical protein|nr:glycine zipper family protein [Rickettsiales bacterium]
MESSGAAGTDYSDQFIENIVRYISGKEDLLQQLEMLLKLSNLQKEGKIFDESAIKHVSELLMKDKDLLKDAIDIVEKYFEQDKAGLAEFLEQVNKVKGMEGKLEALGNQLLTQGIISAAAIATLTGIVAGTLAIGGVAGALMGGGLALAGLVALVAIVAIGYAIYQHRGEMKEGIGKAGKEVKEGAVEWGKAIKSLVKDLIDKLPTFQARENNFSKLREDLLQGITGYDVSKESEKIKDAQDKVKVIKMLQSEGQRSAIKELIKDGTIQNFSEDEMKRLIEKGLSTHETDKKALEELMDDFLPKIMAIGEDKIEEVEKKVNEKVEQMKPPSAIDNPSFEPLEDPKKTQSP